MLFISGYFIVSSYFSQLNLHKERELNKLDAIVSTLASQINPKQFSYLIDHYPLKDDIVINDQDGVYKEIHSLLLGAKNGNHLNTDIYTITLIDSAFYFGVSSSLKPYFRHQYFQFPEELISLYDKGGSLDFYESENGTWLSANAPIKNNEGMTIALIQADQRFDDFIAEAKSKIFINISISLVIFTIIVLIMISALKKILRKEDELKEKLVLSKFQLERKNKETADSIRYAKRIQESILPIKENILNTLKQSFILYLPKDIVSGDFYWYKKIDNRILIAAVDCTGHGVPGALMSMIGNTLLNDIVSKGKDLSTNSILNHLNKGVVRTLKQKGINSTSNDGMDIALCSFNLLDNILEFSGAQRPLYLVRNDELTIIKGDALSIGGAMLEQRKQFNCHEIQLKKGDTIYLFSDGYPDQFGGDRNKKYLVGRFKKFLSSIQQYTMDEQETLLKKELKDWMGDEEQVDDILIIGFRV
jgi:serine phosphatase RsbU (regulator of sigma subunit)